MYNKNKIRVMIVDDHELIREGLSRIIDMEEDIEVVYRAKSGQEAIDSLKNISVDLILLDINMPNMNGIETLKKLKKSHSKIKVVMLTVYDDVEYVSQSVNLEADGYILKDSDSDTLIKTIKIVYEGGSYIEPTLASKLIKYITDDKSQDRHQNNMASLTKREIQVIKQIALGLNNKNLALTLNISEKTVKNHVSSILRKLDLQDRTQIAIFAIKNKIVEL